MRTGFLVGLVFVSLFLAAPKAVYAAASLSLSPAAATKSIGDTFNVDVVLDTGGDAVSGATAIINYDAAKLQVVNNQLLQGTIFNQSPLTNTVNTTTGQIQYDSGSLGATYTGHGTMATIQFKTIAAGTATVSFVFDANATADTSLVAAASGPTNLLTVANSGTYTITSGGTVSPQQNLPPTGAVENTLLATAGGVIFLGVGFVLSRRQNYA
jgi:LPXTG-motif cell wall-anchored protein